ncbi:hypothetical protein [Paenibacillus sp. MBLB4367]|uniref:hypothetical protein n=1 Tax=Paenibacillus sp. MBLB4367 TaxID=3384767 RepID=UPI003907F86A
MSTTALIQEGDWVSGTSQQDEKFIGYVESMNQGGGLKVWVTQCDREEAVGTVTDVSLAKVRKMPDYTPSTSVELQSLIELALATHDKEWFESLSAKLTALAAAAADKADETPYRYTPRSRLFRIAD